MTRKIEDCTNKSEAVHWCRANPGVIVQGVGDLSADGEGMSYETDKRRMYFWKGKKKFSVLDLYGDNRTRWRVAPWTVPNFPEDLDFDSFDKPQEAEGVYYNVVFRRHNTTALSVSKFKYIEELEKFVEGLDSDTMIGGVFHGTQLEVKKGYHLA
jgi:hypothetical protein